MDELARVERFLQARDVRRPYDDLFAELLDADEDAADPTDGDVILRSGEVLTATGHRVHAVIVLEASAVFEHLDTLFVFPVLAAADQRGGSSVRRWEPVAQSDGGFASAVASLKADPPYEDLEVFPLAYRYFDTDLWGKDPHVDADTGWSGNGPRIVEEIVRRTLESGTQAP